MPRIPFRDLSELSPEERDRIGDNPSNVSRLMASASTGMYEGLRGLGSAIMRENSISPKLRELAILRVGYLCDAAYEVFQHEALARHVGLSDAEIAATKAGDTNSGTLDDGQCAVLLFVDDLVLNVGASDATLAGVGEYLGNEQIVDLIITVGYYLMICRLLETSGIELDQDPISWGKLGING